MAKSALLLLCLGGCLSTADLVAEGALIAESSVDYAQSTSIAARCHEQNPLIGTCGEVIPPGIYFPLAMAAHVAIIALLPTSWRPYVEGVSLGTEGHTIYNNHVTGH